MGDREKQKIAQHNWYIKNREVLAQSRKDYKKIMRQRNLEYMLECKKKPCADCKLTWPTYVLDFDHRDGKIKIGNVAQMVYTHGLKAIIAEIAKCDLVCSNCHRIRTHQRKKGV